MCCKSQNQIENENENENDFFFVAFSFSLSLFLCRAHLSYRTNCTYIVCIHSPFSQIENDTWIACFAVMVIETMYTCCHAIITNNIVQIIKK